MSSITLTPTSHLVLGLIAGTGPATSYDLKKLVGISIGYFWTFPHSQLYAEPVRLAEAGYLTAEEEDGGRRRRLYSITDKGREALSAWLRDSSASEGYEIRDLGVLKLFFGGLVDSDAVRALAEKQMSMHRRVLGELETIEAGADGGGQLAFPLRTLQLGKQVSRVCLEFWTEVAERPDLSS